MSETNNSYKIYASKDYVDERALPQDVGEYKQLVTGADGQWKVEDRTHYDGGTADVPIVPNGTYSTGDKRVLDLNLSEYDITLPELIVGETYYCVLDGERKEVVAYSAFELLFEYEAFGSPCSILIEQNMIQVPQEVDYANAFTLEFGRIASSVVTLPEKYLPDGVPVVPVTVADNGKVLGVVSGAVGLVTVTHPVTSVNDQTGAITLSAADVGAEPTITTLDVTKGGTGYNTIADTTYTTARYRASALVNAETTPSINGVINWQYE